MKAAAELRLKPLRLQKAFGAGGQHEANVYRARLTFALIKSDIATEIAWEVEAQGIPRLEESILPLGISQQGMGANLVGLLGRDILRHATIVYSGTKGVVEVTLDLASLRKASTAGQI